MKNLEKSIFQIINHKNKKCKSAVQSRKNITKSAKSRYYNLFTTNVHRKIKKVCGCRVNLFPQWQLVNNRQILVNASKIVAEKLNNNIGVYRGTKGRAFVELVALDCIRAIVKDNKLTAEKYINARYGLCNFYKKELKVLPYLIVNYLLGYIAKLADKLLLMQKNIAKGARVFNVSGISAWNEAKLYGFAKYNKNTLKISAINSNHLKKCVFYFIVSLNKLDEQLKNAILSASALQKTYF